MNWNFQLEVHPDADQLSVFVEGAATAREHEHMLAHLAECAECRKAVFFMQPHEETQLPARTPVKGWIWGRLVPIGLPAAALACGLIAVLIYIRPHGGAHGTPQQIASIKQPEVGRSGTTAASTTDSEAVARSESTKNSFQRNALSSNLSRQQNHAAAGSNLPKPKSDQITAKVAAPQTTGTAPSVSVPVGQTGGATGAIFGRTAPELPLNGRNVTNLQQLQPPGTEDAASQNSLAKKEDLGLLMIEQASGPDKALAQVSGRITDRTGTIISGATVFLRDAAGKMRQTTTSANGNFHLTELPPGQYELTATASGFRTSKQSIELNPSQLAMLQPVLDVGTASEAVTVEAASGAAQVQTESAEVGQTVGGPVITQVPIVGRNVAVLSGLPDSTTVSHGKRSLFLDRTGNLFLSRNGGKKWKKIRPQWTGKAVRIELTPAYSSGALPKPENETLGQAREAAVFLLTTDAGTVWASKDGSHWHQQ